MNRETRIRICVPFVATKERGGGSGMGLAVAGLFTSGYSESARSTLSDIPDSAFLQKPYVPTSLAKAIRRILHPETPSES